MKGNLAFSTAYNIVFDSCEFTHLGGVGLDFGNGSHSNVVTSCYFHDISGAAVQIGSFNTVNVTDPLDQDLFNVVNNSIVFGAAIEVYACVCVFLNERGRGRWA